MDGAVAPVVIENAAEDPRFADHPARDLYGIESYIAVPLFRVDGSFFGTLCALDPEPGELPESHLRIFRLLASLIGFQLEAEEQREERERFVSVLGHDLRTPLQAIGMAAALIERNPAGDETVALVGRIQQYKRRISEMIDGVLDFAQGRLGGGLDIELTESSVEPLVQRIVEEAQRVHSDCTIEAEIERELHTTWDEGRVGQALANLIRNACIHADSTRPVRVEAGVSDGGDSVVLRVHNAGETIPAAIRGRLFEPFVRGSNGAKGLGLGLYIVAAVARAHGGDVSVSSAAGQTTFSLVIPRQPGPAGRDRG